MCGKPRTDEKRMERWFQAFQGCAYLLKSLQAFHRVFGVIKFAT
jgi:hypothetical protein